jgi:hypothetical protein
MNRIVQRHIAQFEPVLRKPGSRARNRDSDDKSQRKVGCLEGKQHIGHLLGEI